MASSDAAAGERVARKCISCHTFVSGGGDGTGPNLYDVIGEPRAYQPGFNYSDAMRNAGGTWTYENLFEYLRNPRAAVPGTNMSFAGLPKPEDRADLLAYMITEDTDAPPLPEPVQPEPTAEEAAEGEAADPAADDAASDAPAEDPTAGESADPAPAEEPAAGE